MTALGNRDDQEVRVGLYELARKELVRPFRNSSMEGQQEFSFWHTLVRDVACAQIPRATRGAKHKAMAAWIEAVARDRIGDHAEVLGFAMAGSVMLDASSSGRAPAVSSGLSVEPDHEIKESAGWWARTMSPQSSSLSA